MNKYFITLLFIFNIFSIHGDEISQAPVAFKGRIHPFDAYARLWLYDFYHAQQIKKQDRSSFNGAQAQELILSLQLNGHKQWDDAPLFWVHYADLKKALGLDPKTDRFSFNQIDRSLLPIASPSKLVKDEAAALQSHLQQYSSLNGAKTDLNEAFEESDSPLPQRLRDAGSLLKMLPGKTGEWYSLDALRLKVADPAAKTLIPIGNFTPYPDPIFLKIQKSYLSPDVSWEELSHNLIEGYAAIAGKPYKKAFGKQILYPTLSQLSWESFYYKYPLTEITILAYLITLILLLFYQTLKKPSLLAWGMVLLSAAFCLHTFILALRCYILARPPVSNMFETVIYVPWIGVLAGFILWLVYRNVFILFAAAFASLALLILLQLTHINSSMENVQAVLDSQYWLIVHVLLVVGSYGVFILSGLLGQIYLVKFVFTKKESAEMETLAKAILQTLYLGVAMLIPGTILGGVWAAESWGRFWDWDPKESWAFISSCVYLIWIHAYTFKKIGDFGLAVGSLIGLMAISFTWYGVNYILGTGLHSYGFGSGGEIYYYLFILLEIIFLAIVSGVRLSRNNYHCTHK